MMHDPEETAPRTDSDEQPAVGDSAQAEAAGGSPSAGSANGEADEDPTLPDALKEVAAKDLEAGLDKVNDRIEVVVDKGKDEALAAIASTAGKDEALAAIADIEAEAFTKGVEAAKEEQDRATKLLFLYLNIAISYWALFEYFWVVGFPRGHVVRCQLVYVVATPLYKPLALSMWTSLMAIVHFACWFRHSKKQPGKLSLIHI